MNTIPTQTSYLFAGAYATARMFSLVSENQIERLLGARNSEEMQEVLHSTFLAPFISKENATLNSALEEAVAHAKKELLFITPCPDLLSPLWMKYDFFNIRNIIKGERGGLSDKEIISTCFTSGLLSPEELLARYRSGTLSFTHPHLDRVVTQAKKETESYAIDVAKNKEYFSTIAQFARSTKNVFIARYLATLIDIYNLKIKARTKHLSSLVNPSSLFVQGGTIPQFTLIQQSITELYARLHDATHWKEALQEYEETGSFALLDKLSEEYLHVFLKRESIDLFSVAPQYAYFNAVKNTVQTLKAIISGKDAGITEAELRRTLRRVFI